MNDLLNQEIAWCKDNRGASGKSEDFENGFIEGLKQAMLLLSGETKKSHRNAVHKMPKTDA